MRNARQSPPRIAYFRGAKGDDEALGYLRTAGRGVGGVDAQNQRQQRPTGKRHLALTANLRRPAAADLGRTPTDFIGAGHPRVVARVEAIVFFARCTYHDFYLHEAGWAARRATARRQVCRFGDRNSTLPLISKRYAKRRSPLCLADTRWDFFDTTSLRHGIYTSPSRRLRPLGDCGSAENAPCSQRVMSRKTIQQRR